MRYLSFLVLLLWAAGVAKAQNSLVVAQPNSTMVAGTAPDTVAAIHQLFAARRKRRSIIAGVVVVGAVGASSAGTDHFLNTTYYTKLYGVLAAVGVGVDLLAGIAFSRSEERRVVILFQEHQLPKYMKRKLKPRYFRPSRKPMQQ